MALRIPNQLEENSLYTTMLANSDEVRWYPLASGTWSTSMVEPTREERIKSWMQIGVQVVTRVDGKRVVSPVRYPSRDEAEAVIDQQHPEYKTQAVA